MYNLVKLKIYIWNCSNGNILNILPGHLQNATISNNIAANNIFDTRRKIIINCNAVDWNPRHKELFVSESDDGLIKVWKITY